MKLKTLLNNVIVIMLILSLAGLVATARAEEAILKIGSVSDKSASVDMVNTGPVRGAQFTVSGVKMTEVRTTPRTAGFIVKFNEANGMVVILSTSQATIPPGKGAIAEVICDKPAKASLSGTKIVYAQ
jgi:hypothetical protein